MLKIVVLTITITVTATSSEFQSSVCRAVGNTCDSCFSSKVFFIWPRWRASGTSPLLSTSPIPATSKRKLTYVILTPTPAAAPRSLSWRCGMLRSIRSNSLVLVNPQVAPAW